MSPRPADRHTDPYAVLDVPADASRADITAAYRRLVRALHPDRHNPDPERLAAVLDAYDLLRDPQRRAAYDHTRSPRGTTVPVHHRTSRARQPDLRAGPVRHHRPAD